jgi:hypothetical protein
MLSMRDDGGYALYEYSPSLILAIIGAVVFSVGGIIHIALLSHLKAKYFIPFAIGCFSKSRETPNANPCEFINLLMILQWKQ